MLKIQWKGEKREYIWGMFGCAVKIKTWTKEKWR